MAISQAKYEDLYYRAIKQPFFEMTGYNPHPKQEEMHRSATMNMVGIAGRRSGKTKFASKEIEVELMQPNKRIWSAAPTYDLTDKIFREVAYTMMVTFKGQGIIRHSDRDKIIKTAWGSEYIGKTTKNPNSLLGEGLDLLVYDECAKDGFRIWDKYLNPTLTDRSGRAIFITTPEGNNWVKSLYERGIDSKQPDWESFHFTTLDNPYIDSVMVEKARKELTPETFKQEYEASFTAYAGKVFKDWDISTHGIARADLPEFEKVILGIDFGFVNPAAVLAIGIHDGCFYVVEEMYKTGLSESAMANEVRSLYNKYPKCKGGYADPADSSKLHALRNYHIRKAKKEVDRGIQCLAEKMKINGSGTPKLRVTYGCKNLINELDNYRYQDKKGLTDIKEQPIKSDDHAVDALRYAIYTYDKGFHPRTYKGAWL
jgi:PBSX family phage terminase large subunit